MSDYRNPFTVQQLGTKARSKVEVYRVLTTEGGIYLPPIKEVNYVYLKGVCEKTVPCIEGSQVKNISVPQFETLTIDKICAFASKHFVVYSYFPERNDKPWIPNRNFVCNLVNTMMEKEFGNFIKKSYEYRQKFFVKKNEFGLNIKPRFIDMFTQSSSVAQDTGRSHFLMRKKKRSRKEMEDDQVNILKEEAKEAKRAKFQVENIILDLKEQVELLEQKNKDHVGDADILKKLFEVGIIDREGNPMT